MTAFSINVLKHVLLHETGHALLHQFNIPILSNEESIADSFATQYITQNLRDDAVAIITNRAQSWLIENAEIAATSYNHKSEHELDVRRAYRSLCLLYGADPAEWKTAIEWASFSSSDLADCSEAAPNQIQGWKMTLSAITFSDNTRSTLVKVIYGDSPYRDAIISSGIVEDIANYARMFKWQKSITFHFDHCNDGAYWSAPTRTIKLCDNYVKRFVSQGRSLNQRDITLQ